MDKGTQIASIIASRSPELILDALWDDPTIVDKIKANLEKVSTANIRYYKKYFCENIEEVKK